MQPRTRAENPASGARLEVGSRVSEFEPAVGFGQGSLSAECATFREFQSGAEEPEIRKERIRERSFRPL